jgi:hypothetical protein
MPRQLETPETPEAWCHRVQHLLRTLRDHQKHNETLLDDVFFQTVSYFKDNFDFEAEPEDVNEQTKKSINAYKKANKTMKKLSKQIVKTQTKETAPYIEFFEAMIVTMPPAKTCVDCGIHFHPTENAEKRSYCLSCM